MTEWRRPARSALYVPGDAADKLARALERGADELIIDLEDAVPPHRKDLARAITAEWLAGLEPTATAIWVRTNPGDAFALDLDAILPAAAVTGLVLAKTQSRRDVARAAHALDRAGSTGRLMPLLESAVAIAAAESIATGSRVDRLQVGEADLAADLGITSSPDELELMFARSTVVHASAAAAIAAPIGPVSVELRDLDAFRVSTERLARLGFVGRACIHPAQVAIANEVFTPSPETVDRARALLEGFDGGVGVDADGRFVDEAVLRRARGVLDLAR